MRLTLVISTLGRGGAERVISVLGSLWAEQGKLVTIVTLDETPPAYPLHSAVQLRRLGVASISRNWWQALWRNFCRVRILREAIRTSKAEIVISFMDKTNILTLLATWGLGRPVVISEHTDPGGYDIGPIWSALRRGVYRLATVLVCPTHSGLQHFRKISAVKSCVIPYPVVAGTKTGEKPKADHDRAGRTLVAMGRLVQEKGFDLLLEAFSRVTERNPQWCLLILGNGPLRSSLQLQVSALSLDGRVRLLGEVEDPFPILRTADLFALSSRVEGFPNALCEAMACGVPVVSFDCPAGPRDIVRHEVDGILVAPNDVPALAAALDRLMRDSQLRQRLSLRAPEVLIRFSRDRVLALWETLLSECC